MSICGRKATKKRSHSSVALPVATRSPSSRHVPSGTCKGITAKAHTHEGPRGRDTGGTGTGKRPVVCSAPTRRKTATRPALTSTRRRQPKHTPKSPDAQNSAWPHQCGHGAFVAATRVAPTFSRDSPTITFPISDEDCCRACARRLRSSLR